MISVSIIPLLSLLFVERLDISSAYGIARRRSLTHWRTAVTVASSTSSSSSSSSSSIEEGSANNDHAVAAGNNKYNNKAIEEATDTLSQWDRLYNTKSDDDDDDGTRGRRAELRPLLVDATLLLNEAARIERQRQVDLGRCMLGICASSTTEGIAALKAWVTALRLPRGLLHGMDVNGVPVDISGGVYIKYNSGGVYTFADVRKSQMGFDALWKPGDAMLEEYEGEYRGVYFQVELSDGVFRQFLLPLDTFVN